MEVEVVFLKKKAQMASKQKKPKRQRTASGEEKDAVLDSDGDGGEAVAAVPPALTISEFTAIHRFLHDESASTTLHLDRFHDVLVVGKARWKKRKVVLPELGEVSIPDDGPTKTTAYAGRARAGGCISWWNPMKG